MTDPDRRPPNVLLINCDDLGFGDLGCYGSTRNHTPHVDRLAEEGTRFTSFYMASAVCTPSRGAMFTGCYPPRIGFDEFDGHCVLFPGHPYGLSDREETVASLLRERGYATRLVGKWHCGDQPEFLPTRHGFDGHFGLPYSNDMSRQRGQPAWPPLPLLRDEEVVEQQPDMAALTERYVADACAFIRTHRDRPFFLCFSHMYVHLPLIVPQRFLDRSENGRYGAAVAAIDWATGVLMRTLADLGLDDDTLVLFTSDNGSRAQGEGGSNAPLRGHKAQTWEGGQRVPLIARQPGAVPAGRVCDTLCSAIDFLPTLARRAGARMPENPIDGVDLAAVLAGDDDAQPREEFCYFLESRLDAVRDRRFKLYASHTEPHRPDETRPGAELFDLLADPGETTDVAADHPDVVARLRERHAHWNQRLGPGGSEKRPAGEVKHAEPLTRYDATYPYFAAEYDLADRG